MIVVSPPGTDSPRKENKREETVSARRCGAALAGLEAALPEGPIDAAPYDVL